MIQFDSSEVATFLKLLTPPKDVSFQGLSIDSRRIEPGNLFVAIQGNHLNGHDFIQAAYEKGAAAALVETEAPCDLPQFIVKDTTLALGELGAAWRNRFTIPIIAVTGSNGKTTLKNMIQAIFVAACGGNANQVLATIGTLNNQWGLPLTLSHFNHEHRYAVIEMGMNHFGEIAYLTTITRPTIAVITNAAASHLEGVGDIAGVARAKAEIFSGLAPDGHAILNRDDAYFDYWFSMIDGRPHLTFGLHQNADIRATIHEESQTPKITLHTPKGDIDINLTLLGKHNVLNALAASAATLAAGMSLEVIKQGLESVQAAKGRLQLHQLKDQVNVIDDSYNANPFSLQAAIDILTTFKGKKILVLGDMKELGEGAVSSHQQAGMAVQAAGIDLLFTYGDLSLHSAHAFGKTEYHFNEQNELIAALKPLLTDHTTVLVKGSRSMHMENIVANLIT